jgi:peptidoglycan/LPS O-acetylase OafA/YrhL
MSTPSVAAIAKDYGDTTFITGMRAYAALAVVLTHTGGAGLRGLGLVGERLIHFGAYGVSVFFVISGFSVAASYAASGSFRGYLLRRFARIAPLYYLWIVIACVSGATASEWQRRYGVTVDAYNVAMHLTFLSFLDYRIACTILGVEWSLPIEVVWYLMIPALLCYMVAPKKVALAVALSILLLAPVSWLKHQLPMQPDDAAYAVLWSPLPHAPAFVLGIAAFRLRAWVPRLRKWAGILVGVGACAVLGLAIVERSLPSPFYPLIFAVLTAGLISAGSRGSRVCNALFCNRPVLFLGTISYGIYLSHFPVLRWLRDVGFVVEDGSIKTFACTATVAIVISIATYYLCERPGQRIAGTWLMPVRK